MPEVSSVRNMLDRSLEDVEPPAFRQRLHTALADITLTPAVITVRTARALEPSIDLETCARRATGVQLTYEGLRLTRSILREERWDSSATHSYYLDLLAAAVILSRGYYYIADTGVAKQSVEAARRFGRHQMYVQTGDPDATYSLEADFVAIAVNAGADLVVQTVPPSITAYGENLAHDIGEEPLPEPDEALVGLEERISTLAGTPEMSGVDEYDE